jgi:Zn-dependent protease
VRLLGLDPRLGAELCAALEEPLRRPPLALRRGRTVDPLQLLQPLPEPGLFPLHIVGKVPAYHWGMLGGGSITLFHVRGIRIAVDWSWFLFLFLVIFWMSDTYGDLLGESSSATTPFLLALLSAAGFFGSILLHELGHAAAALRNGIGITGIQLWIFGGMARMDREAESPAAELKVALAGPLVTLALFVVFTVGGLAAVGWTEFEEAARLDVNSGVSGIVAVCAWLSSINLLLLVFNMLPAFPMDGGRVARAVAWWRTGDRNAATRFAANLGRLFGYLFIAAGIYMAVTGLVFGGIWLALIGMVINGSAKGAAMQTALTSRIGDVVVADVMDREPVAIPGDLSVERALDEYFLRYRWPWFPVVDAAHRFLGLLRRDRADEVPEPSRASSFVSDFVDHDSGLYVRDDAPLDTLLSNQNLRRFGALMAVDSEGRLSGVVTVEQVGRALRDATAGPT